MRRNNFWLDCPNLSGTGNSEPDLLKLTRGNFKRRDPLRSGELSPLRLSFTSEENALPDYLFQELAFTIFVTDSYRTYNHENEAPYVSSLPPFAMPKLVIIFLGSQFPAL